MRNVSKGYIFSQTTNLNIVFKQIITLQPAFRFNLNHIRYSMPSLKNATYLNQSFMMGLFWTYPKRITIENNWQYTYNAQVAPGFRKGITYWNAAINWQLFKNRQGTVRLAVYDILKQNAGVSRSITETYIEDRESGALQRYFMLGFIYELRNFRN